VDPQFHSRPSRLNSSPLPFVAFCNMSEQSSRCFCVAHPSFCYLLSFRPFGPLPPQSFRGQRPECACSKSFLAHWLPYSRSFFSFLVLLLSEFRGAHITPQLVREVPSTNHRDVFADNGVPSRLCFPNPFFFFGKVVLFVFFLRRVDSSSADFSNPRDPLDKRHRSILYLPLDTFPLGSSLSKFYSDPPFSFILLRSILSILLLSFRPSPDFFLFSVPAGAFVPKNYSRGPSPSFFPRPPFF